LQHFTAPDKSCKRSAPENDASAAADDDRQNPFNPYPKRMRHVKEEAVPAAAARRPLASTAVAAATARAAEAAARAAIVGGLLRKHSTDV